MPFCPNPNCDHRRRLGEPAEFLEGVATCSDCGSTLSEISPHFAAVPKPEKVNPQAPQDVPGWTCPQCGSINRDDLALCSCGYDSNRSATSDMQGTMTAPNPIEAFLSRDKEQGHMIEKRFKTFWRRVWAGAIDGAIFLPLSLMYNWVWSTFQNHPVLLLFWFIFSSTAFHIYSIIFHGLYGQTLGKMAVNVRVIDILGNKLSMSQAFRRDMVPLFLFAVSLAIDGPKILNSIYPQNPAFVKFDLAFFLTLFTGIGWFIAEVITMLTNNRRRAIHDYIAGSVVVKTEKIVNARWSWTASIAVCICFILFIVLPVYKVYLKKKDSLDHSKNSQNITSLLKPDKSFPFIGFWKKDCKDSVGLAIDKTADGKYSVSYCTATHCYKPGTEMPNTNLIDDPRYRIINENTIEFVIADNYVWRYYRCTP